MWRWLLLGRGADVSEWVLCVEVATGARRRRGVAARRRGALVISSGALGAASQEQQVRGRGEDKQAAEQADGQQAGP